MFHYIALLDTLGLAKVSLVGLSLGGWIAAELALRRPDRVESLVLVDAASLRVEGAPVVEFFMATPAQLRPLLFAQPALELAKETTKKSGRCKAEERFECGYFGPSPRKGIFQKCWLEISESVVL